MSRLTVVKIGGAVIDDAAALDAFLKDFAAMPGDKILVHGGGRDASAMCRSLDIPVKMIDGRRVTDAAALDVATMVYAGRINKRVVATLQALGCNAIGLSGADGNAIRAVKRPAHPIDYGFVGDVTGVNAPFIDILLRGEAVPVMCALTHDGEGNLLNTNADTIAQSIAEGMSNLYDVDLVYCFELPGVMADIDNPDSLVRHITFSDYQQLKADSIVSGGMLPKLDNAFRALEHGVKRVMIKNAANLANDIGTVISAE